MEQKSWCEYNFIYDEIFKLNCNLLSFLIRSLSARMWMIERSRLTISGISQTFSIDINGSQTMKMYLSSLYHSSSSILSAAKRQEIEPNCVHYFVQKTFLVEK